MKDKLKKLLTDKEARKAILLTKSDASKDVAELRSINTDIEGINGEIVELRSMIDAIPAEPTAGGDTPPAGGEQRGAEPNGELTKIGTFATGASITGGEKRGVDAVFEMPATSEEEKAEKRSALFDCGEYRSGYFKALAGRKDFSDTEKRALTIAADSGGAAVPTTTYGMIIKRMEQTSALFGLVQKTYIPGNVVLPVANAQTAALWTDTAPTPDNDDTLSQVSIGAFALSKFAKVKGQLILMAIDALEAYVVSAVSDQLAIAVENAILNGTGSGQPTGILSGVAWGETNSVTYTTAISYDDMVNAKSKLGLYRNNAVWVVSAATEAQIYKVKTSTAQPLFTQNPITGLIANPLGFPIVVDYYMPDNTVLLMNPDYYYMNINQSPTITADDSAGFLSTSRIYRGTMFLDGKPALDSAFVRMTKE